MALSILIAVFFVSGVTLAAMLIIASFIEIVDQRRQFEKWQKSQSQRRIGECS